MSEKKPLPALVKRTGVRCPVCGENSYSLTGIHPQCSVKQADEVQMSRLRLEKQTAIKASALPTGDLAPWQKRCPKCKKQQHVRKTRCACGYVFGDKPGNP